MLPDNLARYYALQPGSTYADKLYVTGFSVSRNGSAKAGSKASIGCAERAGLQDWLALGWPMPMHCLPARWQGHKAFRGRFEFGSWPTCHFYGPRAEVLS